MTSAALTVALQTAHRNMPNFVIKANERQDIIAYILLERKPLVLTQLVRIGSIFPPLRLVRGSAAPAD